MELEWWYNELDALIGNNFIDIQVAIDKLIDSSGIGIFPIGLRIEMIIQVRIYK